MQFGLNVRVLDFQPWLYVWSMDRSPAGTNVFFNFNEDQVFVKNFKVPIFLYINALLSIGTENKNRLNNLALEIKAGDWLNIHSPQLNMYKIKGSWPSNCNNYACPLQ